MIGADLDGQRVEELEQTADTYARGKLITGSRGLIFQIEEDDLTAPTAGELEDDIRHFFSRKVSALQNARVVSSATEKTGRWENDPSL
jgi:hypothetical protein